MPHPDGTPVDDVWDIPIINPLSHERLNYPTQKPEALLGRIVKASSNPGGLVLDCFVGSGTTAAVAEKLGRRWIAADLGRFAIATTRKRLLAIPEVKPFQVQNLGRYERQAWQSAELEQDYRGFPLPTLPGGADAQQFVVARDQRRAAGAYRGGGCAGGVGGCAAGR